MRKVFFKGKVIATLAKWSRLRSRPINKKERYIREACLLAHVKGDIIYFGNDVKAVSNPVSSVIPMENWSALYNPNLL